MQSDNRTGGDKPGDNRFFDDLARLASGGMSTVAGMRRELEVLVRQNVSRLLDAMDVASRDEVERVKALVRKINARQEEMEKRLQALETLAGTKKKSGKSAGQTSRKRGKS